ncbi:MAG: sensor histidine kinase [Pseudomonadota bacterium]
MSPVMVEPGFFAVEPDEPGIVRLFDQLYDPAFLIEVGSGRFLGVNRAALDLLGYTADDIRALGPSDIHPHEIPKVEAFLAHVRAHGRWAADDLSCRTRAGTYVPAEIRATQVRLGERDCVLTLVRDRRPAADAALGQSLRRLMHDLRNTLTTSQLAADRLMLHPDAAVRRGADTVVRSVERAVEMCRATLRLGRADPPPPTKERFLLADVVSEVAASLPVDANGRSPVTDASEAPVPLDADFDQIYRLLLNLARNAGEAGAQVVRIAGSAGADGVTVDIADDGPGLPEAVRTHLFDEAPASKPVKGTGLGLAIAHELARNHGGDLVLVHSGPEGTVFRLHLPPGS